MIQFLRDEGSVSGEVITPFMLDLPVKEFCYLKTLPNLTAAVSGEAFLGEATVASFSVRRFCPLRKTVKAAVKLHGFASQVSLAEFIYYYSIFLVKIQKNVDGNSC